MRSFLNHFPLEVFVRNQCMNGVDRYTASPKFTRIVEKHGRVHQR